MNWQPSASPETLRARAQLLARIRDFFRERGVLEVDTPVLSAHATVDRHIESFRTVAGLWLHTSPEFAMKRLLAAGSGPIYQLCHVFRQEESGRHHNPEFLMLEWYRPGFDHHALMTEVEGLLAAVGGPSACERLSYRDAFLRHAGFDPHAAPLSRLREGVSTPERITGDESGDRDFWLDLWMSWVIGPVLGQKLPCLLYDYPASQAALARVRADDPPVAERFELYWRGVELANGFHELTDGTEQQRRFEADQAWRRNHGRMVPPFDQNLIAALHAGMPACAGVALGVDRLLMLLLNLPDVISTLAFGNNRA
jgi:lysyl-tRNA synthetase class 2